MKTIRLRQSARRPYLAAACGPCGGAACRSHADLITMPDRVPERSLNSAACNDKA